MWLDYAKRNKRKALKMIGAQQKKPRTKRSDKMKILLEENGYRVVDDMVLDARSQKLGKFLANGKVELKDGNRVSAHSFLQKHKVAP